MSAADFDWGVSGDLLAQLRAAEATISRVRALGEGWVGFDDSHYYGDAIMKIVGGAP